ncbi:MAG: hypothetical protein ABMA25_19620, partial [Ilumatobacteraceae bacterium]
GARSRTGWIEVTVGVLGNRGSLRALSPSLTVASDRILSLEEKFMGGTGVNLTPPPVPPLGGAGSTQVLSEPTPSGIPYSTYASSLAIAQQLGDALANDDWATARRLEPDKAGVSDAQYRTGYDGLDRVSLVLVDVRPEGPGYRLLVVSVANERAGARTSLYCLEWTVDPVAGTVVQHNGVVGRIARVDRAISPEEARLDGVLDSAMRTQCVWS